MLDTKQRQVLNHKVVLKHFHIILYCLFLNWQIFLLKWNKTHKKNIYSLFGQINYFPNNHKQKAMYRIICIFVLFNLLTIIPILFYKSIM